MFVKYRDQSELSKYIREITTNADMYYILIDECSMQSQMRSLKAPKTSGFIMYLAGL